MRGGCIGLLVFEQGVRSETDHFLSQPVIDILQCFHNRHQFIDGKDARGFFNVAKRSFLTRHSTHQLRRHAVGGKNIVTRNRFDIQKLIFCRDLTERYQLYTILTTARRIDPHVFECAFSSGL